MAAGMSSTPPLGKYLASADKKTRDKAIQSLSAFLSSSEDALPQAEMNKLWKGIFYCFWMSDKPLVQQALASELAELLLLIEKSDVALGFLHGFWETTTREWNGIDRLRMDKYYMLVRRFLNASFRLLAKSGWQQNTVKEYHAMLTRKGGPLCPEDPRVPTSLTYHLSDIYLEELDKALSQLDDARPTPLDILIQPFLAIATSSPNKTTYKHVERAVFEPLFDDLLTASAGLASSTASSDPTATGEEPAESDEEGERKPKRTRMTAQELSYSHICYGCALPSAHLESTPLGSTAECVAPGPLRRALLAQLFDFASATETRDANRRKMYAFWKIARAEDEDEDEE